MSSPFANTARVTAREVFLSILGEFQFGDGTVYLHLGSRKSFTDVNGQRWTGSGKAVSISGLSSAMGITAPVVTVKLSGVDSSFISRAMNTVSLVKGNPALFFLASFDSMEQPLDPPAAMALGIMDVMTVTKNGPTSREISLSIEMGFAARGQPSFGLLTDEAQQGLYAGDLGLSRMWMMANKATRWPT